MTIDWLKCILDWPWPEMGIGIWRATVFGFFIQIPTNLILDETGNVIKDESGAPLVTE